MRYLIVLDGSEPGIGYDVTVPDLPGCTSAGDTLVWRPTNALTQSGTGPAPRMAQQPSSRDIQHRPRPALGRFLTIRQGHIESTHLSNRTLGEAVNHAAEAIRGHVQTLVETGQPVGVPSAAPPADLPPGHVVGVVDVDLESDAPPLRAVRLNVSIPATALALIDAAAKIAGASRSAFLTRAALTYIEREAAWK